MRKTVALSLVVLGVASGAFAQSPDDPAAAAAAYDAKDWTKAVSLYGRLATAHPGNPRYALRLGQAHRSLGDLAKAREAFEAALKAGLPAYLVGVPLASVEAGLGEKDKALAHLGQAVEQGYSDPDTLESEAALVPLRSDPLFAPLVEKAKRNRTPCVYAPESRQFDFWVGDWDVVATDGAFPQGTSHVVKELGECVIWENWTSAGNLGYAGKSYNVYNTSLKRWEQFWVDNGGGLIQFYGHREGDIMDYYTGEETLSDGTHNKRHLQFFKLGPDTVRQLSQQTKDGGKSWQVEYDFTYHRHKS